MDLTGRSIAELARALVDGRTTSRALIESALGEIAKDGTAFTRVTAERARAEADHADRMRTLGAAQGPFGGIPISVK
ncbi:MAG: amidase, partial [Micropepsaceae bacterium]